MVAYRNYGNWWETGLASTLPAVLRSVTYYTNYTPPVKLTGDQIVNKFRDPNANPYLVAAKPTVVFDTLFGSYVAAPYGEANPEGYKEIEKKLKTAAGAGAGVLLLGAVGMFFLGRMSASRGT